MLLPMMSVDYQMGLLSIERSDELMHLSGLVSHGFEFAGHMQPGGSILSRGEWCRIHSTGPVAGGTAVQFVTSSGDVRVWIGTHQTPRRYQPPVDVEADGTQDG